jgi:hypothetical protein
VHWVGGELDDCTSMHRGIDEPLQQGAGISDLNKSPSTSSTGRLRCAATLSIRGVSPPMTAIEMSPR